MHVFKLKTYHMLVLLTYISIFSRMSDRWQIIYFMDEESAKVVPEKWIFVEDNKTYSYWPNIRSGAKIVTAIKTKQEPKEDWQKYRINFLSRKVYTNFNLASIKASKAIYMDNISTQSEAEDSTKKRLIKGPLRFEDSSDEHDDQDSNIEIPVPPKPNCSRIEKNKQKPKALVFVEEVAV